MSAPVFGSLVPLVGRTNTSILAVNQVRWFKWSLFYQEYVAQGYADIHDPNEPGVVVALKIDGTAATYSALPTTGLTAGMVYVAGDTGRAYVWSGSSWPAANAGIAIQGPRGYTGNGVESVTVSGNSLVFHMTDGNALPPIYLQVLADLRGAAQDAQDAAAAATTARDEVDTFVQYLTSNVVPEISAKAQEARDAADEAGGHSRDAFEAAGVADGHRGDAVAAAGAAQADRQAVTELRDDVVDARNVTTGARDETLTAVEGIAASVAHVDQAKDEVVAAEGRVEDAAWRAEAESDAARISANEARESARQAFDVIPPATDTQLGKIKLRGDLGGTAEEPTIPALSGKRDVVTGTNRVYTTDASGTQTNVPYSSSATATTIMLRDTAGRTKVASPSAATDATNKDYVDTGLAKKANLGPDGKIVQAELPAIAVTDFLGNVASQAAMLALVGQRGDWCNRTDLGTEWQLIAEPSTSLSSWQQKVYPASDVRSVNGRKGAIELSSLDVLDSTPTGRALMKADDQASARVAIDAASQAYMMALEQTLDAYFNALNLRDAGAWSPSTSYGVGQVVTYNHGRYYCREGHSATATFPAANYVWLGLAAVAATSDPGGGRLWVKI
ncbi:hypothetical protein [Prescottella equi]|uniref:hypothetical protein n=1 Tax=Rhodococcus hoagii TaxID=43767 RepID=UPI00111C4E74|nr:hypothetical protein [Prescottella equi]